MLENGFLYPMCLMSDQVLMICAWQKTKATWINTLMKINLINKTNNEFNMLVRSVSFNSTYRMCHTEQAKSEV